MSTLYHRKERKLMIKINELQLENVKRIKAVKLEPAQNGLTVIGGKNGQGKTSVIDSIAWALGGDKYRPSQPQRDGSVIPPILHIELSNGLIVERKGKNSALKVIDPNGNKGGQQLLNEFIEQFALDLPKFMQGTSKEKAEILLQVIGVGEQLYEIENREKQLYNERTTIGRIADQKKKFAEEIVDYPEAPKELISISELILKQQEILAKNGENQRKREKAQSLLKRSEELKAQITNLQSQLDVVLSDLEIAQKSALDLHDESTEELEQNIKNIEQINIKVRANMDKDKAEEEAKEYKDKYDELTTAISNVRKEKTNLLKNANLPLDGLSVEDGELTYKGFKWDNMSGAEQMKVSTAIVRKLNPDCGFVLLDKLEQMDTDTLKEFGEWLEKEGLQAIATRVSTGEECSIIIEDGYSSESSTATPNATKTWKEGEF